MKLYMVHCGFYDDSVSDGLYESHSNFFVTAESFEGARARAKQIPEYKKLRMHVDGIQEIEAVDGMRLSFQEDVSLCGGTIVKNFKHRDLAAKPIHSRHVS